MISLATYIDLNYVSYDYYIHVHDLMTIWNIAIDEECHEICISTTFNDLTIRAMPVFMLLDMCQERVRRP